MAIGSLDRAGRLEQLRTYAAVQVRSGFRSPDEVRADVLEAVSDEIADPGEAGRVADEFIEAAREAWQVEASGWPEPSGYERLQAAFADLEAADIVVLQAVDDHWAANDLLVAREAEGRRPRGVAYFTHTDVWHAVEHKMLEVNLWHGSRANVADSDEMLTEVIHFFAQHGLPAAFDEGRIEVTVSWQRRP